MTMVASVGQVAGGKILGSRHSARRVDVGAAAKWAAELAIESYTYWFCCDNGGSVSNNYGYAAATEAVVAISDPYGVVAVWIAWLPANKVSLGGSAAACCGEAARPLWDERIKDASRKLAAREYLKELHAQAVEAGLVWSIDSLPAELRGDGFDIADPTSRAGAKDWLIERGRDEDAARL